jgi:two-component system NarL family response regulator
MTVRVVLADDHTMLRESLSGILRHSDQIDVVGQAATGAEALTLARELEPDVLVLDIGLPDVNGIEITEQVLQANARIRILALSGHTEQQYVRAMLRVGASGYVAKTSSGSELLAAILAVAKGGNYLSSDITGVVLKDFKSPASERSLGRRELQVLRMIAEGKRTAEIAAHLHIAPSTVETHRRNIMRKLDAHSVAELTKYAIREGLTTV